jgi:hypothetical protein
VTNPFCVEIERDIDPEALVFKLLIEEVIGIDTDLVLPSVMVIVIEDGIVKVNVPVAFTTGV